MIKTKNIGVQKAKYVIREMSLSESLREMADYYRKKKMDRKSEDAYVYDRGVEKGIEMFILDNIEENVPRERIIEKLQMRFQLPKSKAEDYVERCEKRIGE